MRVGVLYTPSERTPNREFVTAEQVGAIARALDGVGWTCRTHAYDPSTVGAWLAAQRPGLVLNLAYGFVADDGSVEQQPQTAARLERLGCALVGAGARAQGVAQDKLRAGAILARNGILTPAVLDVREWARSRPTAVRKPRFGACHRGVSIVGASTDPAQFEHGEEYVLQEYVDGVEYTVGVLGNGASAVVLPPLRVRFQVPDDVPRVMVWDRFRFDFEPEPAARAMLEATALRCAEALEMRDYCRIDVRVSARGVVVLDVNALPNLDPAISLLPMGARAAGIAYDELVRRIVASAAERHEVLSCAG